MTQRMFAAQWFAEQAVKATIMTNARFNIHPYNKITNVFKELAQKQMQELRNHPPARELLGQAMVICAAEAARYSYLRTRSLIGIFRTVILSPLKTLQMMWPLQAETIIWERFATMIKQHLTECIYPLQILGSLLYHVEMDLVDSEQELTSPFLDRLIHAIQTQIERPENIGAVIFSEHELEHKLIEYKWQQFVNHTKLLPADFDLKAWLGLLLALLNSIKRDIPRLQLPPHGSKYYVWRDKRYKRFARS